LLGLHRNIKTTKFKKQMGILVHNCVTAGLHALCETTRAIDVVVAMTAYKPAWRIHFAFSRCLIHVYSTIPQAIFTTSCNRHVLNLANLKTASCFLALCPIMVLAWYSEHFILHGKVTTLNRWGMNIHHNNSFVIPPSYCLPKIERYVWICKSMYKMMLVLFLNNNIRVAEPSMNSKWHYQFRQKMLTILLRNVYDVTFCETPCRIAHVHSVLNVAPTPAHQRHLLIWKQWKIA